MHRLSFFLFLFGLSFSCSGKTENKKENAFFDLASPVNVYTLPKALKEVSGIHYLNSTHIACIQDEEGKIFFFNMQSHLIDSIIPFWEKGDYEGITKVAHDFFILRSDGVLFQYTGANTLSFITSLSKKDNTESLCYDSQNHRLLIGCKNNEKAFFEFSLHDMTLGDTALFAITQKNIFPSAVGIHPITQDIYILSKKKLLVLNEKGEILNEYDLHKHLFRQPEGISFKENGDMFISNEGKGGKATILEFKYQTHEK